MKLKLIAATVLSLAVLSGSAMAQSTTTPQTPWTGTSTAKSMPKTKLLFILENNLSANKIAMPTVQKKSSKTNYFNDKIQ